MLDVNEETPAQVDILIGLSDLFSKRALVEERDSSLLFSLKAKALAEKIDYDLGVAEALYDLGKYYVGVENNPAEATGYLLKSLELFTELNHKEGISKSYMHLGLISYMLEYYEDAVKNFHLSLKYDNNDISIYLMALSYTEMDSIRLAKEYFSKAIEIYTERESQYRLNECYLYLGKLYLKTSSLDSAFYYMNKSIGGRDTIGDPFTLVRPYSFIAEVYLESGVLDSAIYYGESALRMRNSEEGKSADELSTIQAAKVLSQAYARKSNFERAHFYLTMFNDVKDHFSSGSLKQRVADMKSMFQFEQEMNLQKLSQEKDRELAEAEISTQRIIRNAVIVGSLLLLGLLILVYNRYKIKRDSNVTLRRMNDVISLEKQRSDDLLLNILPEDVAEELKSKGKSEAREYDTVSILFSDFKEFTRKSEWFTPKELVAEIGTCFQAFDGIMERFSVEKIKTIGDAYMAAGGLSDQSNRSIKKTVDAALEMQHFIDSRKREMDHKGLPAFEMRIGIHAGPVVAGIVGVKKFQYDLWGDTVNTASRIESSGEVGKVNISKAVYDAIKEEEGFVFESRGAINAKGKGSVEMWFVSKNPILE